MRGILTTILLVAFFSNPIAAQELTGTLQQIQKTGKIKIGYRHSQPPMSFLGKGDKPDGYSIDICKHIVNEIKNKIGSEIVIEYVPVTAEDRFLALAENKIDILCGATTKTLSRSEIVDFTQLTFITGASFMTLKGKKIRNNFEGKKIGVVKSTTTAVSLKKLFQKTSTDAEIILFDSSTQGLRALEKEKIDAFSADQVILIGLALSTDNPNNFSVLTDLFTYEPFAFAVRRNDADFRLIADRVISNLYRTRQILEIYNKWFGEFSTNRSSAFNALIQINATPE
jgi:glutamate/aspartate transport system substrate-binding protein